jgi:hypothetical protein
MDITKLLFVSVGGSLILPKLFLASAGAALLVACAPVDGATPYSTPSQRRPAGIPQSRISDGDLRDDDD